MPGPCDARRSRRSCLTNPPVRAQQQTMYTLAHLSDVHLGDLGFPRLDALLSKRILGLLSWHLRRKAVHEGPVLASLVADLHRKRPDHTAVTGDLVNLSLPEEFERAAIWLAALGPPDQVSVIPGNHDAYVPMAWNRSLAMWADYMTGDGDQPKASSAEAATRFPYLRRRGPLALIGISTAAPMPPHMAAGRIGPEQLQRLQALLGDMQHEQLCRVLLIHHPPISGPAYRHKQLLDGGALCRILETHGAELVLHGHTHMSGLIHLKTPKGSVPVVGVPSASARPTRDRDPSRYHLYRISREGPSWRIEVEVRGVGPALDQFIAEPGFTLTVAA
jgi:3',5'-cyclic AMP phosphodiesterase CpdA